MLGRLSSKLLKRCMNKSKMIFRQQLTPISLRTFAASKENDKRLLHAFGKELDFERDNYSEISEKAEFLNTSGYQFTESSDGVNLILSK